MIGVFSPEREYKMKGFGGTLSALDKTEGHFCSIFILSLFLMICMNVEKYGILPNPLRTPRYGLFPGNKFYRLSNVTWVQVELW